MQLSHIRPVAAAKFDDPNLVSCAGLVPTVALAQQCGLAALADERLMVPTDKGANAGRKITSLVAGMVAGAGSIDDMALLRQPIRLIAIPGMGELLSRLVPPSPKSVLRFASFVGEKATLAAHQDLVDLMVATGRDPIAAASARAEIRVLVSPFALLSPSGFRRHARVRPDDLRQLAMPTLVVWGEQDPLGSVSVAQAVTELIPHARLKVLPTGHAPWLGQPAQTAATVADFVR